MKASEILISMAADCDLGADRASASINSLLENRNLVMQEMINQGLTEQASIKQLIYIHQTLESVADEMKKLGDSYRKLASGYVAFTGKSLE